MAFEVKLPLFEGPFDLLLFFIERDELDIYDIPISRITEDFLSYLHQLEEMNIEIASEFILVASTLMRIKVKMLLPRPTLDEEGNEIDPREELVKHGFGDIFPAGKLFAYEFGFDEYVLYAI